MTSARKFKRRNLLQATGAAALGLSLSGRLAQGAEEPKLNFYNWDTYIGETTLDDFKAASGIEVTMDLFGDNDELFAKLREGNPGYDVIVPTNDYVHRMIEAGMLQRLNHSKIPNFRSNVASAFKDVQFDPKRAYSMPYMWGTIGIGYRKSRMKDGRPPTSWSVLFDSDAYKGKIALMSESTSVLGTVQKYLGYSYNSASRKEIAEAADVLIRQKPNILTFAEDNGQDLLLSGECDLVMEWNGDIVQVMAEDDDIGYVIPREGGLVWEDSLAIPVGAPHPENAHAFMNYILDAEVGALIADFIQYATPNEAARALMSSEYRENVAIFPPEAVMASLEPSLYKGEEVYQIYEEEWTRVLSS